MAVKRTRTGYQLWWYDAEGKFRKGTIKGIARDEAVRLEREFLAARDRGERQPDERHAPLFDAFATQWIEESRGGLEGLDRRPVPAGAEVSAPAGLQ